METPLIQIVQNMGKVNVLLIGDMMLDKYLFGNAERVSPEAPMLVLHYQSEDKRMGGAANVAAMLRTLGATVHALGVAADDEAGTELRQLMQNAGIDPSLILKCSDRPTTCKLRLIGAAQHRREQQLLRLDYESTKPIPDSIAKALLAAAEEKLPSCQVVCIEDYNKGVVSEEVCKGIIAAAKKHGIPVFVDPPSGGNYRKYAGATLIKPNRPEAAAAVGMKIEGKEHYALAADKMLTQFDIETVVITLDKEGAFLATRDGTRRLVQHARPRRVVDATGAGDMMLCVLALSRAAGADWVEAVALGNIAAGLEVETVGTVPITQAQIIQELQELSHEHVNKQRTLEQFLTELARHRSTGKRVVFTNGCFDLIHLGHVKYFQYARHQGDLLVVGVNSDASIRRLKGEKRPIISEADRIGVLEELESIDYLITFDEDTPLNLIKQIRPDVLVKGADYQKEEVVGWDVVESYGGKLALAPLVSGKSTTAVIQRILETHGK